MSTSIAGTVLVIPSAAMIIGGPIAGALSDMGNTRKVCIWAAIIGLSAFGIFGLLNSYSSLIFIAAGLVLMGQQQPALFNYTTGRIRNRLRDDAYNTRCRSSGGNCGI